MRVEKYQPNIFERSVGGCMATMLAIFMGILFLMLCAFFAAVVLELCPPLKDIWESLI